MGIHLLHWPLEDMRGYYYQNENGKIIVINSTLDTITSNFVCAHELGHSVLHGEMNRVFLDSGTLINTLKYEKQANIFGMCLMYPNDAEFMDLGDTVEAIANRLGAREELVVLRILECKKIDGVLKMFCPNCGKEVHGKFCSNCGTRLSQRRRKTAPQPRMTYHGKCARTHRSTASADPQANKKSGLVYYICCACGIGPVVWPVFSYHLRAAAIYFAP